MLIFIRGGETFYDIFCTENILNLSFYQTMTSLKIFVNNILDKAWKGTKKEKHCETCRKLLLAFSPFSTMF